MDSPSTCVFALTFVRIRRNSIPQMILAARTVVNLLSVDRLVAVVVGVTLVDAR